MPQDLYITFSASDALYDEGGPLFGSDQRDELILGPFPDFVQITYDTVRVGDNDEDTIAFYRDGLWRVGVARIPEGNGQYSVGPCDESLLFSDLTLTATHREADDPEAEYIRVVTELSTAHISKSTNDLLFDQAVAVPDDQHTPAAPRELPVTILRTGHGFFISVPADSPDGRDALGHLPTDIAVLLTLARQRHSDWLLLDADGPVHDNLEQFVW